MSKGDLWMPLFVADYLGDTMHLTTAQHGAYLLLLMHQWRAGVVPDDDVQLAAIVRSDVATWRKSLSPILRPFFRETPAGLIQKRLASERDRADGHVTKKSAAGKAGAEARWANGPEGRPPTGGKTMANASQTHGNRIASANGKQHGTANGKPLPRQCLDDAPPPPPPEEEKLASFCPTTAREREWPEPAPGDRLTVEGYEIFQRRFECMPHRTSQFLGSYVARLADWVDNPERRVMGVLRLAERENPKNSEAFGKFLAAWLTKPKAMCPALRADFTPQKMLRLGDAAPKWADFAEDGIAWSLDELGESHPTFCGYHIDVAIKAVCEAAGICDPKYRGDFEAVLHWLRDGFALEHVLSTVRAVMSRVPNRSVARLRYFDQAVREARKAA